MRLTNKDIVLFSGDSITDGNRGRSMDCNHIMGHGYQSVVAGKLALDNASDMPKFINKGYSGDTSFGLLEKWREDVIDNKPTVISLLVGVNDGGTGYFEGISPQKASERYEESLRRIVELTQKELGNVKFIILEPFYFPLDKSDYSYRYTPHVDGVEKDFKRPDSNDPEDSVNYRDAANRLIRAAAKRVAEDNGCIFVPLYDKFLECFENSRREYFIWDGTHPSIAGHMLIADQWLKALDKA